jgi:hypothetical protein
MQFIKISSAFYKRNNLKQGTVRFFIHDGTQVRDNMIIKEVCQTMLLERGSSDCG